MHFRQSLPRRRRARSGYAAADGQMGQIMQGLSGLAALRRRRVAARSSGRASRRAIEFAWIPDGWDADRDGVLEGVQHNTYDVEFYGPNPHVRHLLSGRAARGRGDGARRGRRGDRARSTAGCSTRAASGSTRNLFNGEYYIQKVRGQCREDKIAPALLQHDGLGRYRASASIRWASGCLVDQLVGQYMADVAGLGPLVDPARICARRSRSIYRYNYKRTLSEHDNVQRTFALNDEAALVVCDYGKAARPRIPFPYYAEVLTGLEYTAATHMMFAGMMREGVEIVRNARARYDGERRNPWDEPECGHHYARAMAAWSAVLALSGFHYHGGRESVSMLPLRAAGEFRSFWSSGTGWGTFSVNGGRTTLRLDHGTLACRSCSVRGSGAVGEGDRQPEGGRS